VIYYCQINQTYICNYHEHTCILTVFSLILRGNASPCLMQLVLVNCAVRARRDASSVPGPYYYSDPFEAGVKVYLILSF
jgi:hypothetical protein